jgi:hypothetical protein
VDRHELLELERRPEPTYFGPTAEEAFRFIRGLGLIEFLLSDLDDTRRAQAVAALRATIEAH